MGSYWWKTFCTQSDEENASAAAEYVENEDPLDVQNILEPIHLAGTTTKDGRWKCPFCPYETKQKHNVTKHIKSKKKEHVKSFMQKKIIKDDVVKNEIKWGNIREMMFIWKFRTTFKKFHNEKYFILLGANGEDSLTFWCPPSLPGPDGLPTPINPSGTISSISKCQLEIDLSSIVFDHHHLFSLEHYLTRRLNETYVLYSKVKTSQASKDLEKRLGKEFSKMS